MIASTENVFINITREFLVNSKHLFISVAIFALDIVDITLNVKSCELKLFKSRYPYFQVRTTKQVFYMSI